MSPADLIPDEPCAGRGSKKGPDCLHRQVSWSPAFGLWLCGDCRLYRTDMELRATKQENESARLAARQAAARDR